MLFNLAFLFTMVSPTDAGYSNATKTYSSNTRSNATPYPPPPQATTIPRQASREKSGIRGDEVEADPELAVARWIDSLGDTKAGASPWLVAPRDGSIFSTGTHVQCEPQTSTATTTTAELRRVASSHLYDPSATPTTNRHLPDELIPRAPKSLEYGIVFTTGTYASYAPLGEGRGLQGQPIVSSISFDE